MDAVRTPLDHGTALALGNRRFRKQLIRLGDLHYQGGTFPITEEYLDSVVKAFDARAVPAVPFQLADHGNRHTEDPERRRGTVVGLHRTPDGLDGVLELSDAGAAMVDEYPDLGVSVLVKHNRTTGEGLEFPAVLCHVLGTTDPVLTQLGPWCPELAASNDTTDVLDLLALTAAPVNGAAPLATPGDPAPQKEAPTMADTATLTPEDVLALRSLASVAPALVKLATAPTEDPADTVGDAGQDPADTALDEQLEMTEADIKALADLIALDDEQDDTEDGMPLAASHDDDNDEVMALSQRLDEAEQHRRDDALALSQLRAERDETRYLAERDQLARQYGVHPSVTDIVRPLLEGSGQQLALSNGRNVDPAALIRKFVQEISTRPRLDLSQPKGYAADLDDDEDAKRAKANEEFFAAVARRNG